MRHKRKKGHPIRKAVVKGIFRALVSNPPLLIIIIVVVVALIAYTVYSIDYQLKQIMVMYQSLSAKVTDSKAGFDKRLFYVKTDENGNQTIVVGYRSEEEEEAAQQAAQEAGIDPDDPPNTEPPAGDVLPESEVAKKMIQALHDAGYNDYAICGVLGNCHWESGGLNTGCTQGHAKDGCTNSELESWIGTNGKAVGLPQWDGGRAVQLLNAAKSAGKWWADPDFQIQYLIADMPGNGCAVDRFNEKATDLEHAAFWFCHKFERCSLLEEYKITGRTCSSQITYEQRYMIHGWTSGEDGRWKRTLDIWTTYFESGDPPYE